MTISLPHRIIARMAQTVILVDYENVQAIDLSRLPTDARVVLVMGANQKSLPTELVTQAQLLGERFVYVPIKSRQPNGVDFCIAFYLGKYVEQSPESEYVILSRDKKGFDPLVEHLSGQPGIRVRRVDSQDEIFPSRVTGAGQTGNGKAKSNGSAKAASPSHDDFARALDLLMKEKSPPKKRSGIEGKLKSWFPERTEKARKGVLNRLINEGHVSIDGTAITYPRLQATTE